MWLDEVELSCNKIFATASVRNLTSRGGQFPGVNLDPAPVFLGMRLPSFKLGQFKPILVEWIGGSSMVLGNVKGSPSALMPRT